MLGGRKQILVADDDPEILTLLSIRLTKRGYRVRIAIRRPHLGAELRVMGDVGQVQLVQANVRFPQSIDAALEEAHAVEMIGDRAVVIAHERRP